MHCAWSLEYHSLGLTRIQFRSPKVTPLTNTAKVTDQGLCYCNSNAWGCTTAIKVESSALPISYFPELKKAPKCTGGTITGPKHSHAALLKQRQTVYFVNHPP